MSLTLNMVGGGGGGKLKNTDAVLIVTVPTGSTVTATKSGITLTPTMWVKAADASLDCAIVSIPASQFDSTTPWTVTATLNSDTASETVLITSNKEYEVELSYAFILFDNGTVSSVLGGLTALGALTINNTINFVEDASNGAGFTSNNSVDLLGYSKLTFIHTISSKPYPNDSVVLGVYPSKMPNAQSSNRQNFIEYADPNVGDTQSTVNISNISNGWIAGVGYGNATVSKIYLSN